MRKNLLLAAIAALTLGAVAATPTRANACTYGETRYAVGGTFLGTMFGYDEYRVVEQTCTGYIWKTR